MNKIIQILLALTTCLCAGCISKPKPPAQPAATLEPAVVETPASSVESASVEPEKSEEPLETIAPEGIDYDTQCDDKACVALYLHTYGELPSNYMSKKEARTYGWESGALHLVVEGKCIGGDVYSNYEGTLPKVKGNTYHECDIDTLSSMKRGAKRIVYSEDGRIYYTEDHYDTFELLYGEEQ